MAIKNLIIIALLFPLIAFSQKKDVDSSVVEVKYYVKFLIDTLNVSSAKEDMLSLRIGKNSSIFRSDFKESSDSLSTKIIGEAFIKGTKGDAVAPDLTGVRRPRFIQEVYYSNGKSLVYDKIRKNTFAFEPLNSPNWKLVDESKTISGYKCKKAISKYGNKNIIAWYTTEIPFQEGPYTFKGLPGLIVSLEDSKQYYTFLLKELKRVKKPINPINNAIKTTYEKYNAKREEVKNDPVGTFANATTHKLTKEQEERIKMNSQSKNNQLD
ncbi:GLPGLI family protein [Chryseobacterium sp. SL1]|uniref:GLPGLI family protein n=1 Tax=Chryseobacterium sp. SL1 TaxID=2995159 RepID=UPI002274A8E0|nr:GLPGLI family protein [Chryseobacterium sp. SL1]MCY1659289.1 GLPGLI family protein [Chryseobacterium sp. SL1]